MTKYIVDMNKGLYEQSWWNLLKPEVKLKAIKHWEDTDKIVDEKISSGEIKIDPTIPLRNMGVDIPSTNFIKPFKPNTKQTGKHYNNKEKKNG
jgi:hypothetical protein